MQKVIHAFFVITGGTLGYLYGPLLLQLLGVKDIPLLISLYFGSIIGAIIFFLFLYLLAGYVVRFLKCIVDVLVIVPIVCLLFRAIFINLDLFVSKIINIPT